MKREFSSVELRSVRLIYFLFDVFKCDCVKYAMHWKKKIHIIEQLNIYIQRRCTLKYNTLFCAVISRIGIYPDFWNRWRSFHLHFVVGR